MNSESDEREERFLEDLCVISMIMVTHRDALKFDDLADTDHVGTDPYTKQCIALARAMDSWVTQNGGREAWALPGLPWLEILEMFVDETLALLFEEEGLCVSYIDPAEPLARTVNYLSEEHLSHMASLEEARLAKAREEARNGDARAPTPRPQPR